MMAFGSGDFDSDDEVMSEINMTPLVDVMLVLLIIFMVTMPVLTHAVKVQLPQAASAPAEPRPQAVTLVIDAAGGLRWNDEVVDAAGLERRLAAAARAPVPPEIRISADRNARYEPVAQALAATQRAGLSRVGILTLP
ncbi:MAG: exbD [Moraxellaceae bacterium]|jgi:biopolymer transport protein ExbD|nr:exbD [Moraxellaceae bacterium]